MLRSIRRTHATVLIIYELTSLQVDELMVYKFTS